MIKQFLKLIRVNHWIKNIFVFAPLIFSLNFLTPDPILRTLYTFFAFSFAASAVYILNDIIDRDKDKNHPLKKDRPIASGKIPVKWGVIFSILSLILSVAASLLSHTSVLIIVLIYITINIIYSLALKHEVLFDVIIIALGFVLRIGAGAAAIQVIISGWIFLTTLFISLFLGFAKRRHELLFVEDSAGHRPVLKQYSVQLLDFSIVISVTLTIITYALYVIDPVTVKKFGTNKLIYTVPLVVYGLFRYLYVIYKKEGGGDPAEVVLQDKPIFIVSLIWSLSVVAILYFKF